MIVFSDRQCISVHGKKTKSALCLFFLLFIILLKLKLLILPTELIFGESATQQFEAFIQRLFFQDLSFMLTYRNIGLVWACHTYSNS